MQYILYNTVLYLFTRNRILYLYYTRILHYTYITYTYITLEYYIIEYYTCRTLELGYTLGLFTVCVQCGVQYPAVAYSFCLGGIR